MKYHLLVLIRAPFFFNIKESIAHLQDFSFLQLYISISLRWELLIIEHSVQMELCDCSDAAFLKV